ARRRRSRASGGQGWRGRERSLTNFEVGRRVARPQLGLKVDPIILELPAIGLRQVRQDELRQLRGLVRALEEQRMPFDADRYYDPPARFRRRLPGQEFAALRFVQPPPLPIDSHGPRPVAEDTGIAPLLQQNSDLLQRL